MKPFVSVVMPAYNAENYIAEAIESVLGQTYSFFELIIVEDASTDKTLEVIQSFSDPRIKLLINPENKGISYSTNLAIKESKGKYIALLDDDDVAIINRLQLQVDYLEKHPEIDVLGGGSEVIDSNSLYIKTEPVPRCNPLLIKAILLFQYQGFANGTAMIRKEFIKKNNLYYKEEFYGMQDLQFYMESSKVGNISAISQILLKTRIHETNYTTNQIDNFKSERADLYAKMQRKSIKNSGFVLTEKQLLLINSICTEQGAGAPSWRDIQNLYCVFSEMIYQAGIKGMDFLGELKFFLKQLMIKHISNTELF